MSYRFALITGATSGIGEALARALPAQTGLLLTGRDGIRLAALKAELDAKDRQVATPWSRRPRPCRWTCWSTTPGSARPGA